MKTVITAVAFISLAAMVGCKGPATLVRLEKTDGVFLIQDGKRKPISSADVMTKCGWKFEDVKSVTSEEFSKYPEGPGVSADTCK